MPTENPFKNAQKLVQQALAPLMEHKIPHKYVQEAFRKNGYLSGNQRKLNKPVSQWDDPSALLNLIIHTWKSVFRKDMGYDAPMVRAFVSEFLTWRNKDAHTVNEFSNNDIDRMLDTAERLLISMSIYDEAVLEQVGEIKQMRQNMGELTDSSARQGNKEIEYKNDDNTPNCPKCHSNMVYQIAQHGDFKDRPFWRCSTDSCNVVSDAGSEFRGKNWPSCPRCNSTMVGKRNHATGNVFWGCWKYFEPENCKGTRQVE